MERSVKMTVVRAMVMVVVAAVVTVVMVAVVAKRGHLLGQGGGDVR
jgi:hypothetical protein